MNGNLSFGSESALWVLVASASGLQRQDQGESRAQGVGCGFVGSFGWELLLARESLNQLVVKNHVIYGNGMNTKLHGPSQAFQRYRPLQFSSLEQS